MRVVVVGPRPGARGGIAQFTGHLVRALDGHADVRWLSFARLYPARTGPGRNEIVDDPEGSPAHEPMLLAWRPSTWRASSRWLAELRPGLVVLQWWHPAFGPCLRAVARAARRAGARTAFVCHNATPHERFPLGRRLSAAALAEGDRLLALSEATAEGLRALVPAAAIAVRAHPPFAFPATPAATAAWRARIGPAGPVITFFGYVRPYKGVLDLIAAMPRVLEEHPHATAVVAGPFLEGPGRYERAARAAGVAGAVRLLPGYVPDEEVGGLLAASDVVALPYRSASQSGVLPVALAAGVPVVVTAVGGLAEALGSGGEVVSARDPEALAAGILRALAGARVARPPAGLDGWAGWREELLSPGRVAA